MNTEEIRKKNYEAAASAIDGSIADVINKKFGYRDRDNKVNAMVTVDLEEETAILYVNIKMDTNIIKAHYIHQDGRYKIERIIIEQPDGHAMQTAHAIAGVLRDSIATAISLAFNIRSLYVD